MKMKKITSLLLSAAFMAVTLPVTAHAKDKVPIDYWALRDTMSTVAVSPDGKHVLVMKIESKEGEHILEIYDTSDFSKPLRRLNADPMEMISASWIDDNRIFGTAWKVVRKRVKGPNQDVRSYRTFSYNLEKNKFSNLEGNFDIVSLLPKEPDYVLITAASSVGAGAGGVDPFTVFRPRDYYKFNLKKGSKSLVLKGSRKYSDVTFDIDGNPRFAQGFDAATHEQKFYYRAVGETSWNEFEETYDLDLPENLYRILGGFQGFKGVSAENPNIGYFIDNRDGDKAALYEFDMTTGKVGKKLYSNPDADVMGIVRSSMSSSGDNHLVAAVYPGAKRERHWFDQKEKALYEQFEQKIPNAHQVNITSRSRDGKTMVVYNSGPKDPGSYWLVKDGQMAKLGSRNPLVTPEDLSDVSFIKYTARDGMTIPAYLTTPNTGSAPYPLIVLPHGGPHVNEVVSYDEWSQLLANNGYMVLQPEYRMSVGWGKEHFDKAFGQHGLAMQDDDDDGAQYLIDKGLVSKDRVAMFGWSYGGYAALVADSRPNNMYQCVIAGAAVADPKKGYLSGPSTTIKALDEWARARGGFVGINPIKEVEKINIPVLMIHGSVDQRVEYYNYKDYQKEVKRVFQTKEVGSCKGGLADTECTTTFYRNAGNKGDSVVPMSLVSGDNQKTYIGKSRFVTLKGADHFYATLMYKHQYKLYTEMLDFLKNDCGPGGL